MKSDENQLKKPNDKVYTYCLRCHRKLKNQEARLRGYGDVCYRKIEKQSVKSLFTI